MRANDKIAKNMLRSDETEREARTPKLKITVSHQLKGDEALKRVQVLLDEMKDQFADKISDLRQQWDGNTCRFTFSVMGFSVSGMLIVKPCEVELSGNLPLAAAFFKGKIESRIRERANTLLA